MSTTSQSNSATYKGTTIDRTQITTDTRNGVRNVYRLSGNVSKGEGMRPFITSVAAAKRYINETLERREAIAVPLEDDK